MRLWNYIKGSRQGKEANRVEKDAMKDPFLADALEGFDLVKGNHIKDMERLRRQIMYKTSTRKPTDFRMWGIAAGILIVIGAGAFFMTQNIDESKPEPEIAKADMPVEKPEHEMFSLKTDTSDETPLVAIDELSDLAEEPVTSRSAEEAPPKETKEEKEKMIPVREDTKKESETETKVKKETKPAEKKEVVAKKSSAKSTKNVEPVIKGWVTDKNGQPLIGASIFLSGTKKATVSDADGHFEIPTKKAGKIQVNYIGYESTVMAAELGKMTLVILNKTDEAPAARVATTSADSGQNQENVISPVPEKGESEYAKYLKEKIIRPTDECADVKGKVILAFHIDGNGRPYKIRIVQGICPSADREAIRLVRKGPKWKKSEVEATVTVSF